MKSHLLAAFQSIEALSIIIIEVPVSGAEKLTMKGAPVT